MTLHAYDDEWRDPSAFRTPKETGHQRTDFRPQPTGPRHCIEIEQTPETPIVSLAKLAQELGVDLAAEAKAQGGQYLGETKLDAIATLVKALTYGEMMELAEALWKVKGEGEVTQDSLPGMLHRWGTGREAE
jgi:hypothetical protein